MPRGAPAAERTVDKPRGDDYSTFLQWLRRLSRWREGALLSAYAKRHETHAWRVQLCELHAKRVDAWPPLWGCVRKSVIPQCVAYYLDEHPFVSGELPAEAFVNAVVLADARQVALRGGDEEASMVCCPMCYIHTAEVAVLRKRLGDALGERLPLAAVDSEEVMVQYLVDTFHELYMMGVGVTPRKAVRRAITAAVAADLGVDISDQTHLYDRLLEIIDVSQSHTTNNATEGKPIACLRRCHVPGA